MTASDQFHSRGKQSILEKRYLAQVLQEENSNILQDQTQIIARHSLSESGEMRRNRHGLVNMEGDFSGEIEIKFLKYLRFLDMKPKRLFKTKSKRRQYPLYNRIMFGRMSEIIKRLSYGFTEDVKGRIAADIKIEMEP